jgi:hypothetical protein
MPIGITAFSRAFRLLSQILILSLTISSVGMALSSTPAPMDTTTLHQKLHSRGIGSGIRVTEIDGTVVRGTLVELESDSFEVIPKKAVHPTQIKNREVAMLDNDGLPKRAKMAIGVVVGVAVVVSIVVLATAISFTHTDV